MTVLPEAAAARERSGETARAARPDWKRRAENTETEVEEEMVHATEGPVVVQEVHERVFIDTGKGGKQAFDVVKHVAKRARVA